jgi:DNA repair exonuclease SbcCD ATPase subunit
MEITSLCVEGAGRFGTTASVEGLGNGVNILAAGNEAGKSTLFRAIRACLFERHSTTNRTVASLCTEGLSLPITVRLGFRQKNDNYVIEKSFVRSPGAFLRRNGVEIARGRQADEDLWEILGISPGGGRSIDEAAFGLLWVGQGQSFKAPSLTGAAADVLNKIVQKEVGTLVGGERARSVLNTIRREIDEHLTANTGRPKSGGPLGKALAAVKQLSGELEASQKRLGLAHELTSRLDELTRERDGLTDLAVIKKTKDELATAEKDLESALEADSVLKGLQASALVAQVRLDNAKRILKDLKDCAERIDASRNRKAEIAAKIAPLKNRTAKAERLIAEARLAVTDLQHRSREDDALERNLSILASALESQAKRCALDARQSLLVSARDRVAPIEAEIGTNTATADAVEHVDVIERELGKLAARLEAGAAQVSIALGAGAATQVRVDGQVTTENLARSLFAPMVITIADIATVTANPPPAFGAAEFVQRETLEAQLAALLVQVGAASPADLRKAHARRIQLEVGQASIMAELEAVGVNRASLAAEIDRLKTDISAIDDAVAAALTLTGLTELPDAKDVALQQIELADRREQSRRELARFNGVIDGQNQICKEYAEAVGRLQGELDEILRRLQVDIESLPDDTREERLATAVAEVDAATRDHQVVTLALLEQRDKTPSDDEITRLRTRCARLKSALEGQRERLGTLDREIAKLEGQISAIGAEGLGDLIAASTEELELSTRESERLQSRVDMLVLLRDTIERCYRERRDRLNAPVVKHLQPFLTDLFPNATPEFGDGFAITGLRRESPVAERIDILSDGTQEQIAVLVRLALGSMICERGEPVPIILDDALVFSDDDRIERMFDALNRAGRRQQVIILTCRTRTFATLGGRQLFIAR